MKNELKLLRDRLKELKKRNTSCKHSWDDVQYEPEKQQRTTMKIKSSDAEFWPVTVPTWSSEIVPRWSRICNKCGKKEYTYNQVETVKIHK